MTEKPTMEMTREEWFAWEAKKHPIHKAAPPAVRKEATVYAFRQMTYLASQAVYRMAMEDPKGVELFLPPDLSDAEFGSRAHAALAASRFIPPDHPEWDSVMRAPFTDETVRAWDRKLLAAAGVKTLKALRTGARSVSLRLQDGLITIDPWQQARGGGWTGLGADLALTIPESASDADLGRAVREGLSRSR